jgi:twitching motility protein PilI
MAQREALRDLQARLAQRLQAARTDEGRRAWLAVEAAGVGFLFPLDQAGEIFPLGEVLPLAHAKPWFCGVTNLRGGLHGVVDLATFVGLRKAPAADVPARDSARLLALNPSLRSLCALRIDQMAGLRHPDDLTELPVSGNRPSFAAGLWRDAAGRVWQEMDLAELAASDAFVSIAAPVLA